MKCRAPSLGKVLPLWRIGRWFYIEFPLQFIERAVPEFLVVHVHQELGLPPVTYRPPQVRPKVQLHMSEIDYIKINKSQKNHYHDVPENRLYPIFLKKYIPILYKYYYMYPKNNTTKIDYTCVTFGVYIYSLAGLLIPIRLWVCLRDVRRVVMATHADRAGMVSAAI